MNICVIPARAGSKRIPRKNIKYFLGKPIIAYSIQAAISSGCFGRIIVSTDDKEIAKLANSFGAETPFMRPAELSGDYVGTTPIMKHAIEWLEKNEGKNIDNACIIYATAPFVTPLNIKNSFQQLENSGASFCFSATTFPFPIQRAFRIDTQDRVEMFQPEFFNTRSQDLEEAYQDAAQFYWGRAKAFKKLIPMFSQHASAFILPRYLVQDIDTIEDWTRAELMYRTLLQDEVLVLNP